jgi:hypothetical protein
MAHEQLLPARKGLYRNTLPADKGERGKFREIRSKIANLKDRRVTGVKGGKLVR